MEKSAGPLLRGVKDRFPDGRVSKGIDLHSGMDLLSQNGQLVYIDTFEAYSSPLFLLKLILPPLPSPRGRQHRSFCT